MLSVYTRHSEKCPHKNVTCHPSPLEELRRRLAGVVAFDFRERKLLHLALGIEGQQAAKEGTHLRPQHAHEPVYLSSPHSLPDRGSNPPRNAKGKHSAQRSGSCGHSAIKQVKNLF